MNITFIRIHNITFDRYLFLTRKQQKGEPIEKCYGHLKELSENCDLGEKGDTIIRDVFIANMQNEDIQNGRTRQSISNSNQHQNGYPQSTQNERKQN